MVARFTSLSDLVSAFESGSRTPGSGQTQSTDPRSSAQGAYSFVSRTWRTYAPAAGVDLNQYPTANTAPRSVQDQVFAQAVKQRGLSDWTCPGCNAPLTSYVAANPYVKDLPVFDAGSGTVADGNAGAPTSDPTHVTPSSPDTVTISPDQPGSAGNGTVNDPMTGLPMPSLPGLGSGNVTLSFGQQLNQAVTKWIAGIETAVGKAFTGAFSYLLGGAENWLIRGALIILGVILVLVALWRMVDPSGQKTASLAKMAA